MPVDSRLPCLRARRRVRWPWVADPEVSSPLSWPG